MGFPSALSAVRSSRTSRAETRLRHQPTAAAEAKGAIAARSAEATSTATTTTVRSSLVAAAAAALAKFKASNAGRTLNAFPRTSAWATRATTPTPEAAGPTVIVRVNPSARVVPVLRQPRAETVCIRYTINNGNTTCYGGNRRNKRQILQLIKKKKKKKKKIFVPKKKKKKKKKKS